MLLYRISRKIHASKLDGEGARLFGGRWNNVGTRCIYASETRALAVLEFIVNTPASEMPEDLVLITLKVPEEVNLVHQPKDLPDDWNLKRAPLSTRNFGDKLLNDGTHLLIRLPSVVIPEEYNCIINPLHAAIKGIKVENITPFSLDERVKK